MKTLNKIFFLVSLSLLAVACGKGDDGIVEPPPEDKFEADFNFREDIDKVCFWDATKYGTESRNEFTLSWSADLSIPILQESSEIYYFDLPETNQKQTAEITLKLKSDKRTETITKTVPAPPLEIHRKWGLGKKLTKEKSNDVEYYWYVDQGNTGQHSRQNCGPSCCEMAGKWANPNFPLTAEQLRDDKGLGGSWYTSYIKEYLTKFNVENHEVAYTQFSTLQSALDEGNIVILCLDGYYIRYRSDSDKPHWRKDKYYKTTSVESGHFIIVKGYREIDGEYLLEVYDPWSIGAKYEDGEYKGLDRYYRHSDVLKASTLWWPKAIIVCPSSAVLRRSSTVRYGEPSWRDHITGPDTVPDMWGGVPMES